MCCSAVVRIFSISTDGLGVADLIGFGNAIHFLDGAGVEYSLFGIDRLPAPLHLGLAFLGFDALTWSERVALLSRHARDDAPRA